MFTCMRVIIHRKVCWLKEGVTVGQVIMLCFIMPSDLECNTATILSHNVPPYQRAGTYQQLRVVKEALSDYRSEGDSVKRREIIPLVVAAADRAGLFDDLPFNSSVLSVATSEASNTDNGTLPLTMEVATELLTQKSTKIGNLFADDFEAYAKRLWDYLRELENRLFSSGLHVLGGGNDADSIRGYLDAICGSDTELAPATLDAIANGAARGVSGSSLLLLARDEQQKQEEIRRRNASTTARRNWLFQSLPQRGGEPSGVDYSDLFTTEDKFGFSLLKTSGLMEFIHFQWLRWKREWAVPGAEEQLAQLVAIASRSKASSTKGSSKSSLEVAVELAEKLYNNVEEELQSLMRAIAGEYTPAAAGGDVIRDGLAILPTGRNIHALDPYRLPSSVALARGQKAAELILKSHREANGGKYPETVAVTLWGLDTIKTKGESVGIVLALVGAVPTIEATGRVVGFELLPLEKLGRPRIDVLGSLSGIFRDSFGNVLDLLDDLLERASNAQEPTDLNYIRKHTEELRQKGVERPSSRLFSNPPGDFGSMVNEQVGTGDWEKGDQLGDTWESRNAWSYGKGGEKGAARPALLKALLNTTDRVVQEVLYYFGCSSCQ